MSTLTVYKLNEHVVLLGTDSLTSDRAALWGNALNGRKAHIPALADLTFVVLPFDLEMFNEQENPEVRAYIEEAIADLIADLPKREEGV